MGQLQAPAGIIISNRRWVATGKYEKSRKSKCHLLISIINQQLHQINEWETLTLLHNAPSSIRTLYGNGLKGSECSVNVSAQGSLRLAGTRRGQEVDWNEAKCTGNERLNPGKSNAHFIVLCTPAVVVVKHETDENDCERYNTDHLLCLENTCHQNTDHHKFGNRVQTSGVAGNK